MKIADVLSSPDKFIGNTPDAKDHEGNRVDIFAPQAIAWGFWGAFRRCGHWVGTPSYYRIMLAMRPEDRQNHGPVTEFGYNHSYEQCLQLAKDAGL